MHDKQVQQAWREKFTLCFIILLIGGMIAFLTIGFSFLLCPSDQRDGGANFLRVGNTVAGKGYDLDKETSVLRESGGREKPLPQMLDWKQLSCLGQSESAQQPQRMNPPGDRQRKLENG